MSWASSEVVTVLAFLFPGFVGAAVFYTLTSHPKPGDFERVVQALVFTTVAQATTWLLQTVIGIWLAQEWPAGLQLTASVGCAVAMAMLLGYWSNHDTLHEFLRHLSITSETSYPSEMYSAFAEHPDCYVVLHLKGDQRLYGWVEEWPSRPPDGYFRVTEAVWLDHGRETPQGSVVAILVPAAEVQLIEFVQG